MEGRIGKRNVVLSAMIVTMLLLGVGNVVVADVVNPHPESSIASGVYGGLETPGKTGGWYTPEEWHSYVEETTREQFTSPTITIGGSGGETRFDWYTEFGKRDAGASENVTVDIRGGTNIFNHQNIYFGSRRESGSYQGNGQNATVNFIDGDNTFTQRVTFGGAAKKYAGAAGAQYTSGHSTVTFSGGNNFFTYHPTKILDYWHQGNLQSTDPDNEDYSYYYNYFGVYFSAISEQDKKYKITSGGSDVKFTGGTNTFDTTVHFGGNYDLTTYCHTSTSSDDEEVSYAGTHVVNFEGGLNTFDYRTTFGAINSNTTVNFTGGETSFTGSPTLDYLKEDLDNKFGPLYGYMNLSEGRAYLKDASNDNTYRGNDMPYIFFGGKKLDLMDIISYEGSNDSTFNRQNLNDKGPETVVNINGTSPNYKTVSFDTTAFFGGADERWLAGDQYIRSADGSYESRFRWHVNNRELYKMRLNEFLGKTPEEEINNLKEKYGSEFAEIIEKSQSGTALTDDEFNTVFTDFKEEYGEDDNPLTINDLSALRIDTDRNEAATLNLVNGNLTLGVANTMSAITEMYGEEGPQEDPIANFYITDVRERYEQVRLIGAATGSKFEATGGRITFDVKKHNKDALSDYSDGYFHTLENTVIVNGTEYDVLETAMIAFDEIHISANTDIALKNVSKLIPEATGNKEYYTNPTFVDTTGSNIYQAHFEDWYGVVDSASNTLGEKQVGLIIDLDKLAENSSEKLDIKKYQYDKWFYNITVEDVVYDDVDGVQSAAARLHVKVKDFDEAFANGNMGLNKEKIYNILKGSEESKVYQALDYIISTSETEEMAAENFDQLIGASYASMANHQIHRLTTMNTLLANQLMASDVATENAKRMACHQCGTNSCCCCRNWTAWVNIHGMSGKTGMDNFFSGYESDSYGAMFALEYNDCEGFHGGIYFNYGESNLDSFADLGWTSIESTDYTLGLYMKWLAFCGGGYGLLNTNITWSDYDSKRFFNDAPENYFGTYEGVLPSIYYERGWVWFCSRNCTLNPYFSLQYAYFHSDDFVESGWDAYGYESELSLSVSEVDHHSLRTFVGLRLAHDFWLGRDHDRRLTLRLNGAWIHDLLGDCTPIIYTAHRVDSSTPKFWNVRGNDGGRDWANVGIGVDFNLTQRLSVLADYNVFVNEYTTLHTGMASLRFEF